MAGALLLAGLFLPPLVGLWAAHRLRYRSPRMKGAFWGGAVGHTLAALVWLVVTMWPAVEWSPGGGRAAVVAGALLAGAAGGALVGLLRGGREPEG